MYRPALGAFFSTTLAVVLAGCGGGSGSTTPTTSNPPPPTTTALTGKVIDGYISGAALCLDLNANQACDAGEPTATSGADGTYSLDTTGLDPVQVAKAYILVTVPSTAKDADDGGKTLAEAGKRGYTLLAPVFSGPDGAAIATMVTPLTTLMSQQMLVAGVSASQAAQAVRSQFGLGGSGSLNVDYKADSTAAAMAGVAALTAVTLGEMQAAIASGAPTGSTERQKLVAALTSVSQTLSSLQTVLGLDADPTLPTTVAAVKAALQATTTALGADASGPVAEARAAISGAAVSLDSLMNQGFGSVTDLGNGLIRVLLTKGGNGSWADDDWRSFNNASFAKQAATTDGWTLGSSGWVAHTGSGSYVAQADSSFIITGGNFGGVGVIGRFRMEDVAGKPMSVVGETGAAASVTFPTGAQALWSSYFAPSDSYRLFQSQPLTATINGQAGQHFATLADLVAFAQTPAAGQALGGRLGWYGLQYTFDGAMGATGGTLTFWSRVNAQMAQGRYEVRSVNGQQILVITQAPLAAISDAAQSSASILGAYGNRIRPIYVAMSGVVYQGNVTPVGVGIATVPGLNLTALNAVLAARGKCQLLANGSSQCP